MGKRGTPRASCDPCRRKKVKCDKDHRNAQGISLCTFCYTRGYDCIITDHARPNLDTSDNDAATEAASTSYSASASTSASAHTATKKRKKSDAHQPASFHNGNPTSRDGPRAHSAFDQAAGFASAEHAFTMPAPAPETEPDLFSVRGLTRSLLDDAIASHFRTTHWCNPVVRPRDFRPRYRRYLSRLDGIASSSNDYDSFPPPEIVILAVACVGVAQLSYAPHRFELQARVFRRLEKLVSQAYTKDLAVALDVLEAILLTFDVPARTKSVEEATASNIDAGFVHPMSHTKMIRLLVHHGLNRSKDDPVVKAQRLKYCTPERLFLCRVNEERMRLILAVAATNDIIRSFHMFERHKLLQEDIDPDAMMADLGGPVGNQWAWQLSVLASVLRTHNLAICAARSRRLGIPPSAILNLLEQLERFERQIPEALRWDASADTADGTALQQLITLDNTNEKSISNLVRKAFLYVLLWSEYRCLHTVVQHKGLQRPTPGSRLDGSVYLRARQRLDSLLLDAVDHMSEICPQLASSKVPLPFVSVNLLHYSSVAFHSSIKGGADYTLEVAKLTFKAGLHELAADLLSKAGKMLYAFSTYQYHPDTQTEAARMRRMLSNLYIEFDMVPGIGAINDVQLRHERERFSSVFEPAAAFQDLASTTALVSDVTDMQWDSEGPSAAISTAPSWSTPGADDLATTFGGSMNEFLAGLPFVNGNAASASTSPHPTSCVPKPPVSAGAAASPFDLNAFLDTHMDSTILPNARPAASNY